MTTATLAIGAVTAALLIAGATSAPSAQAQTRYPSSELTGITVLAPRITYQRDRLGRVEVAEQSAVVDIADLDLRRTADMYTLEFRVSDAASRVCNELAELYPHGNPSTPVCIRRATDDAMALAREIARIDSTASLDYD